MSVTITIGAQVRIIELPLLQITGWTEGWMPGDVDIWFSCRKFGTSYQLELELSRRTPGYVEQIKIDGDFTKTIPVAMEWPAGRALCYRLGVDPVMHPSWRRRRTKFGPLDLQLPSIGDKAAQQADALAKLAGLRAAVAARAPFQVENVIDAVTRWIGPFPVYLPDDPGPGAPGGQGVYHSRGWQNCEGYAQLACEVSALAASRMWSFRRAIDGAPLSVDHYPGSAITPNVVPAANIKPPGWEGPDPLPLPVADSHHGRYLSWLIAAWEMTGSPLARRQILSAMETQRLAWTERGVVAVGGGWTAENLSTYEALSMAAPGQGGPWDRRHGWLAWGAAMVKKLGGWSPGWQAWSQKLLGSLERSAQPSGLVARVQRPDVSLTIDVAAAMHEALVGIGVVALCYRTRIARPSFIERQANTLYRTGPRGNYYGSVGPEHFLAVGPHGGASYPAVTSGFPEPSLPSEPGDPAHVETYLACLGKTDATRLQDSCGFGTPAATLAMKRAMLESTTDSMGRHWTAFLLAELQAPPV